MRTTQSLLIVALTVFVVCAVSASSSSNPEHEKTLRTTRQCAGCDLRNANLGGFQGQNADLINADLTDATFYGGNLRGANLTGAILDRTNLEMVDLTGAKGATLATAITDSRTTCPDGAAGPCK
jgi:uncharacterized protein YjbI with pentapeptide repeats